MKLTPQLWDAPEDGVLVVELRATPSGHLEFGYSIDLCSLSPARVVFDHGRSAAATAEQLPARLAAAELSGVTALTDAINWANSLASQQAANAAAVQATALRIRQ